MSPEIGVSSRRRSWNRKLHHKSRDSQHDDAVLSNAQVASYLPFEWLLPCVDVLATDAGYGSVNQAMSYGVPRVTVGMMRTRPTSTREWRGPAPASTSQSTSRRQKRCAPPSAPCSIDPHIERVQMADEFARIDTRSEVAWATAMPGVITSSNAQSRHVS